MHRFSNIKNIIAALLLLVAFPAAAEQINYSSSGGGGGGGTPGGSSGTVQYNNSGSFGGFGSWNGTVFAPGGSINLANAYNLNGVYSADSYEYALDYPNFYQGATWSFANANISASDAHLPTGDSVRSFSAWVKTPGTGNYLFWYGTNTSNENVSVLLTGGTIEISGGTAGYSQSVSGFPNDGRYHHVVVVYNGSGSVNFYLDGASKAVNIHTLTSFNTVLGGTQWLGSNRGGSSNNLAGNGAMFQIFNIALSSSQVTALYNSGLGVFGVPGSISTSNVVAQYTLNGNVLDTSASANNGTANNMGAYTTGAIFNGTWSTTSTVFKWDYVNSLLDILANTSLTGTLAVSGNITANLVGNVTGNLTGNVTGTASGNLALGGGTMTGGINMGGNAISSGGEISGNVGSYTYDLSGASYAASLSDGTNTVVIANGTNAILVNGGTSSNRTVDISGSLNTTNVVVDDGAGNLSMNGPTNGVTLTIASPNTFADSYIIFSEESIPVWTLDGTVSTLTFIDADTNVVLTVNRDTGVDSVGYAVSGTAGVSCGAGTLNPVTAVVTNGIITHC